MKRWATFKKGHHKRKHGDPTNFDPRDAKKREYFFRKYGLTREAYDRMVAAQDDRCALCLTDDKGRGRGGVREYWCVDHDHETGHVRALLCAHCNAALGMVKDDLDLIYRMADYLFVHNRRR